MDTTSNSRRIIDRLRIEHSFTIDAFSQEREFTPIGTPLESTLFPNQNTRPNDEQAAISGDSSTARTQRRYAFRLSAYPNGNTQRNSNFISLELCIIEIPDLHVRFESHFFLRSASGKIYRAVGTSNTWQMKVGGTIVSPTFVEYMALLKRRNEFLPDDTLTVGVSLCIFEYRTTCIRPQHIARPSIDTKRIFEPIDCRKFLDNFIALYNLREETWNVRLKVDASIDEKNKCSAQLLCNKNNAADDADADDTDNNYILAHRGVLIARSAYFRAMFMNFNERLKCTIHLKNVDAIAVRIAVEYMYKMQLDENSPLNAERAERTLRFADMLDMRSLAQCCERALIASDQADIEERVRWPRMSRVDIEERAVRLVNLLLMADRYNGTTLMDYVVDCISKQTSNIVSSDAWEKLLQCDIDLGKATLASVYSTSRHEAKERWYGKRPPTAHRGMPINAKLEGFYM